MFVYIIIMIIKNSFQLHVFFAYISIFLNCNTYSHFTPTASSHVYQLFMDWCWWLVLLLGKNFLISFTASSRSLILSSSLTGGRVATSNFPLGQRRCLRLNKALAHLSSSYTTSWSSYTSGSVVITLRYRTEGRITGNYKYTVQYTVLYRTRPGKLMLYQANPFYIHVHTWTCVGRAW